MENLRRQQTIVYGLVGFSGEEAAREYHDGLKEDGDGWNTFHLVSNHGERHGFVYDPTLTEDEDDDRPYRPPSLTTDIVGMRAPSATFRRVLPAAVDDEVDDEFNTLLLVGGPVDCFVPTRSRGRWSREGGEWLQAAVAWGHTDTGRRFPRFVGKKPQFLWGGPERVFHVQRRAAGVMFMRRALCDWHGDSTHLSTSVFTIDAWWSDADPDMDDLLSFRVSRFDMDAPVAGGQFYNPAAALFDERFRMPLERAREQYEEYCQTPEMDEPEPRRDRESRGGFRQSLGRRSA